MAWPKGNKKNDATDERVVGRGPEEPMTAKLLREG